MEKQLTDVLPCKVYTTLDILTKYELTLLPDSDSLAKEQYYKRSDIEALFRQLANPANLSKITKSLMFGGQLNLADLLPAPKTERDV